MPSLVCFQLTHNVDCTGILFLTIHVWWLWWWSI